MSDNPFRPGAAPIPVTLATEPAEPVPGTAILRLAAADHVHESGVVCVACAALTDVRAMLFDLLQEARAGSRPPFSRVVVDASALSDTAEVVARLSGAAPATAYRDHAVARAFRFQA